jgi:transcriptional regulator with XRE-family HTH domain
MVDNKRPRLVGNFIRQRRETLGLSQRALGLLFTPPVTTQFISNVERGVTPLPPAHIPTLTKALQVSESEIMALLEQEYAHKLSGRISVAGDGAATPGAGRAQGIPLSIAEPDYAFMRTLYDAYAKADPATRQSFASLCEKMLKTALTAASTPAHDPGGPDRATP